MLTILRGLVASPLFLELVRQFMRWLGVWLMTIGVPESLAGLTTQEDAIMGVVGFAMYLVAETGWLAVKWKQFKAWWGKKTGRAKR